MAVTAPVLMPAPTLNVGSMVPSLFKRTRPGEAWPLNEANVPPTRMRPLASSSMTLTWLDAPVPTLALNAASSAPERDTRTIRPTDVPV